MEEVKELSAMRRVATEGRAIMIPDQLARLQMDCYDVDCRRMYVHGPERAGWVPIHSLQSVIS